MQSTVAGEISRNLFSRLWSVHPEAQHCITNMSCENLHSIPVYYKITLPQIKKWPVIIWVVDIVTKVLFCGDISFLNHLNHGLMAKNRKYLNPRVGKCLLKLCKTGDLLLEIWWMTSHDSGRFIKGRDELPQEWRQGHNSKWHGVPPNNF